MASLLQCAACKSELKAKHYNFDNKVFCCPACKNKYKRNKKTPTIITDENKEETKRKDNICPYCRRTGVKTGDEWRCIKKHTWKLKLKNTCRSRILTMDDPDT